MVFEEAHSGLKQTRFLRREKARQAAFFFSFLHPGRRNFVSTISAATGVLVHGLMEIYDSHLIGFNVPRISSFQTVLPSISFAPRIPRP